IASRSWGSTSGPGRAPSRVPTAPSRAPTARTAPTAETMPPTKAGLIRKRLFLRRSLRGFLGGRFEGVGRALDLGIELGQRGCRLEAIAQDGEKITRDVGEAGPAAHLEAGPLREQGLGLLAPQVAQPEGDLIFGVLVVGGEEHLLE